MLLKTDLPLSAASTIVDAALAAGRAAGMAPLTVAVLDAGGHLVALKREDGSGILRPEIAHRQGLGRARHGPVEPGDRRSPARCHPAFLNALAAASGGRFVAAPGGVLISDRRGRGDRRGRHQRRPLREGRVLRDHGRARRRLPPRPGGARSGLAGGDR